MGIPVRVALARLRGAFAALKDPLEVPDPAARRAWMRFREAAEIRLGVLRREHLRARAAALLGGDPAGA